MSTYPLKLKVLSVAAEAPSIRGIVLGVESGAVPPWQAGAHIRVLLPSGGDRSYSLMALPGLPEGRLALGVLREQMSTGGSHFMHALAVGDTLRASAPINNFRLAERASPALLFAGGIGITPILSMAVELKARGIPYHLHYCGRAPGRLAFLAHLHAICPTGLFVHYDSDESCLDIAGTLGDASADAHVYVCGPAGMIDAVKSGAIARGMPAERIHFESFKTQPVKALNRSFEIELKSTGQVIRVLPDQSIVQALQAAGLDVPYDCRRGVCGVCRCRVIAGVPDHRDVILGETEKASNKVMQICVSRAKSDRLVLDL